jgi:hypothetical protein
MGYNPNTDPPWMNPRSSFRDPAPTGRQPAQPQSLQHAISLVTIGKPDADGNVWQYQRKQVKPGGPNSPFKPKTVTYLVNQHGVHFQDYFQRNFGIDANGKPVNPLDQPNRTLVPPTMPRNTPPPAGHKITTKAQPAHKAVPGTAALTTDTTPQVPSLGSVKIDPNLIKQVQAALGGGNSTLGLSNITAPKLPSIDPKLFAATVAKLQFQPVLDDLQRQQGGVKAILPGQLANLDKWFGAAQAQASQGAASDTAAYQQARSGASNDAARIISSLAGGDSGAGYALAQQAENNNSTLSGQEASQAAINNALKTNIADQLGQAKTSQMNQNGSMLSDLQAKFAEALAGAGQTAAQGYQQGLKMQSDLASQGLQNDSVVQNMKLAAALAGPQVAGAKLANIGTAANIENSNVGTALSVAKAKQDAATQKIQIEDQLRNSELQRRLAQVGNKTKTLQQNLADPGFKKALHNAIWDGGMVDAEGRMAANPQRSYQLLIGSLKTSYPNASPAVLASIARSEVEKAMPSSIYRNKGWKFNGGKFSK